MRSRIEEPGAAAALPAAAEGVHTPGAVGIPPGLRVRDAMTRYLICVRPDTPVQEVLDLMLGRAISGVPVVDEADQLLGVVTQADLLASDAVSGEYRCAADLMTPHPMTARPDDALADVATRMLAAGRKRLLVVEDGRLVGIVARRDLLRCMHPHGEPDAVGAAARGEVTEEFRIIMADPTGWYDQRETHFWG
jgi:predicted transcriptional regulator